MRQPIRVALAEDDAAVRTLMAGWLNALGHAVTAVADGRALVALCRAQPPDLVVSDVNMPELDGLGAADVLRRELGVPVVLVSGGWGPADRARAADLGVRCLDKPVRPLALVDAIAAVMPPAAAGGGRRPPAAALDDRLFRRLVEAAGGCAVLTVDPGGRIAGWDDGASRLFGAGPAAVAGRPWGLVFPADGHRLVDPDRLLAVAGRAGRAAGEWWFARADGSRFWGHGVVRRLAAGDGGGYGVVVRDRSDVRAREDAARAADGRRTAFLATLAHELRNPLSPLANAAHVIARMSSDPPVAAAGRLVGRQVRHLARLVDDLTDAARACHGKVRVDLRPVDLADVVARAVDAARPQAEAAGHALVCVTPADPVWVDGDPDRLAQVAANLLGNAVKFTPAGGRADLDLGADDGWAELRVRDTGVGIPADRLADVFEPFAQDPRTEGRSGGLGLGLAVVRELVARHGGTVAAFSDGPGRGSEFVVRLPCRAAVPAADLVPA